MAKKKVKGDSGLLLGYLENVSSKVFEKHAQQTNELNIQLAEAKEKVKLLYDRWEELEEISKSVNTKY